MEVEELPRNTSHCSKVVACCVAARTLAPVFQEVGGACMHQVHCGFDIANRSIRPCWSAANTSFLRTFALTAKGVT